MKLKVYKGTSVMSENAIIDLPTGVCSFYMDNNEPQVPGKLVTISFVYLALDHTI